MTIREHYQQNDHQVDENRHLTKEHPEEVERNENDGEHCQIMGENIDQLRDVRHTLHREKRVKGVRARCRGTHTR